MSANSFPYQFISLEGNIGAGKTTLSRMIAQDFSYRLVLEQFSDNPFLPFFYENPERYAFTVELFFMTERYKQLQEEVAQTSMFQESIIADYFFIKTLLFAKNNLPEEEYRLFKRLFEILNKSFPKPDLLVYLHRPVNALLKNIQKRGRDFEEDFDPNYLQQIQQAYFDFFKAEKNIPVVVLDLKDLDFTTDKHVYTTIIQLLQQDYAPGIHHLELR